MKKILIAACFAMILPFFLLFGKNEHISEAEIPKRALTSAQTGEEVSFPFIKYGDAPHAGAGASAMSISDWLYSRLDMEVKVVPASKDLGESPYAVYGRIEDVSVSVSLADAVEAMGDGYYSWGIAYDGNFLVFYANSKIAFSDSDGLITTLMDSLDDYVKDGKLVIPEGHFRVESVSKERYNELLEAKKEEEHRMQVEAVKAKIENVFTESTFDPNGFGITADLEAASGKSYESPRYYPAYGEHPRVLFNGNMIPGIRDALENSQYSAAYKAFRALADKDTDGTLGAVVTTSTYSYNFSAEILNAIQAKAFFYAVYGDEYYGYSAILALLNFMNTLDYNYKQIDQTRDFGAIIYTAACVYDWCYDLLTESTKRIVILGVEHVACRGVTDEPDKASYGGVKLEIGFPPIGLGPVTGHGSEMPILRNFLAFSTAIFDEYPEWYEFCAGRLFEEYIEPRNVYYSAGMYPQGTQYNSQRFHCDLYSAALIKAISGKIPYDEAGMRDTVYGLFATVSDVDGRGTFLVGDIRRTNTQILARAGECAMIASYLFDDPILRGLAQWRENGFSKFSIGSETITPTEFFVFASNGVEVCENGVLDVPSVIYNGGWYGQLSVRESWSSDSAVVLMKVQERTTANHDHAAAGTFQIYYKGMLTGDMGDYAGDVYGSDHCKYFLRSTVAHNGLLIYDESKKDTLNGYYVGGQRIGLSEASSLDAWLANSSYDTGEVLGYSYGYRQNAQTEYAYISGDITKAYDPSQVSYVGRSMLTVYTGDEQTPMVFFVYDKIDSQNADFLKKFLLQVPASQAPVIDEVAGTVEISNGKGKLLLTNIEGADEILPLGGTDSNGNRLNYQINGKQLDFSTAGVVTNRESWGRVELVRNSGETDGGFFNVIQVGDDGVSFQHSPVAFSAYSKADAESKVFDGARVGSIAALFADSQKPSSSEVVFTIPGEGLVSTYIAGLYTGTWRVCMNGESLGTVYSTKDSGMVKFDIFAGKEITLTPTDDVRPANSGEITYVTNGGSFDKKPSQFYPLGVETPLPEDLRRDSDIFGGWYTDAGFTERIYAISPDAPVTMTVYAKWLSVPFLEDYKDVELDNVTIEKNAGGARYSCDKKQNSSFNTDPYRGILVWRAGESGPHITVNKSSIGSAEKCVSVLASDSITVSLSLAKSSEQAAQNLVIRMRDSGNEALTIAYLSGGELRLGSGSSSAPVALTLTDELQMVNITVDFKTLTLTARDGEGNVVASCAISVPDARASLSGLEWKALFDNEIINIRAQSAGCLIVGMIAVLEGERWLPNEQAVNELIFVTNGGEFDTVPDVSYTTGVQKTLPTDIHRDGYTFLGWYTDSDFGGEPITVLPETARGQIPLYAKWEIVGNYVIYDPNGGTIAGVNTYFDGMPMDEYTPTEEYTVMATASKLGCEFLGWFDEDGNRVEKLPAGCVGAIRLSARFSASFLSEDYSETVINTTQRADENGISYSHDSKDGNSFVTNADGEYLTFTSPSSGPHITANAASVCYGDMDSNLLSFRLSFASVSGEAPMDFIIRIRDKGGCSEGAQCNIVVLSAASGSIYLGDSGIGVKLFELSENFTEVRVVLDFEELMLYAYSDSGSVIAECEIPTPSIHAGIDGEDWKSMFRSELFNLRASSAGSIKISEIAVVEGNIFKK